MQDSYQNLKSKVATSDNERLGLKFPADGMKRGPHQANTKTIKEWEERHE